MATAPRTPTTAHLRAARNPILTARPLTMGLIDRILDTCRAAALAAGDNEDAYRLAHRAADDWLDIKLDEQRWQHPTA